MNHYLIFHDKSKEQELSYFIETAMKILYLGIIGIKKY